MEPLLAGLPACVRLRLHGVKVSEQGPLMLTLDGPQRLCGQVSLHGAGRIEARFTVRRAGRYALKVCESETGRALLRDLLDVLAGVAHTAEASGGALRISAGTIAALRARVGQGEER